LAAWPIYRVQQTELALNENIAARPLATNRRWPPLISLTQMARGTAATAALAILLSFTGAFETHTVPVLGRTVYWLSVLFAGRLAAFAISATGAQLLGALGLRLPIWAIALLYLAAATPVITITVLGVTVCVFRTPLRWDDYLSLLGPVFVVTAASTLLHGLLHRVPIRSRAAGGPLPSTPAIIAKLPEALQQADIHAVSAEDHYLRVFTSAGEALIYMRFTDALDALDGIEGTQIHRSHWIARAAVTRVHRQRGKIRFEVKGGIMLPVSRTFQNALRIDGWL
jgi:hypothetical protein